MINRNVSNLPISTKSNLFSYCSGFQPIQAPETLRNAAVLERSLFAQRVSVPALRVSPARIEEVQALLKSSGLLLRRPKIKPLIEVPFTEPSSRDSKSCFERDVSLPTDGDVSTSANLNPNQDSLQPSRKRPRPQPVPQSDRLLLLDSAVLKSFVLNACDGNSSSDLTNPISTREKTLQILLEHLESGYLLSHTIDISYENFSVSECTLAVLPEGRRITGFSQVGHLIHLNLQDEDRPFGSIIGQILLDKTPTARTVLMKSANIANEFRTFAMEVVAGETSFETECAEHGCTFHLDYSRVYWNTRLCAMFSSFEVPTEEHQRIVSRLAGSDVLYDCCAGVGPFVIPALKNTRQRASGDAKGALEDMCGAVLANDLNPVAVQYLVQNAVANLRGKRTHRRHQLRVYNMDAVLFIRGPLKRHYIACLERLATGPQAPDAAATCKPPPVLTEIAIHKQVDAEAEAKATSPTPAALVEFVRSDSRAHVVLNLPAIATTFLGSFRGLLAERAELLAAGQPRLPLLVYCYAFSKADDAEADVRALVLAALRVGVDATDPPAVRTRFVRDVAPYKRMICAEFELPVSLLISETLPNEPSSIASKSHEKDSDNEDFV